MEMQPEQPAERSVAPLARRETLFDSDHMVPRPPSAAQPAAAQSRTPSARDSMFTGVMYAPRPPLSQPPAPDSRSMVNPPDHQRGSMKSPLLESDRGMSEPPPAAQAPPTVNRGPSVTNIIQNMLKPGGDFFLGGSTRPSIDPAAPPDSNRAPLLTDATKPVLPPEPSIYDQPVAVPAGAPSVYDQPLSVPAGQPSIYDEPAASIFDQVTDEAAATPLDNEEPQPEGRAPSFTELVARLTTQTNPPPPESIFDVPVQAPLRPSTIPTEAPPPPPPADDAARAREGTQVGRESSLTRVLHDLLGGEQKPDQ